MERPETHRSATRDPRRLNSTCHIRKALESQSGHKIPTPENHKALTESKKRITRKKS